MAITRILAALLIASSAFGADYWVSPTGVDVINTVTNASITNASKTIQYVVDNADLDPGDTIWVRGGTYPRKSLKWTNWTDNGAPGNPVYIKSYSNETATFMLDKLGAGNSGWNFIDMSYTSWIQHVTVDGSGLDGGHHIILNGDQYALRCIQVQACQGMVFSHIICHNALSRDGIKFFALQEDVPTGGTNDDRGPKFCTVEHSIFYDNGDYGIKVTGWGTRSNVFAYNNVFSNGYGGGGSRYGMNISGDGYQANMPSWNYFSNNFVHQNKASGIQMTYVSNTFVVGNTSIFNGSLELGQGISFGFGCQDSRITGNYIASNYYYGTAIEYSTNCMLDHNRYLCNTTNYAYGPGSLAGRTELIIQNKSRDISVYNNTIYARSRAIETYKYSTQPLMDNTGTIWIKNNIIYGNIGNYYSHQSVPPMLLTTVSNAYDIDYNIITNLDATYVVKLYTTTYTFDDWTNLTAYDQHSMSADPQMANPLYGDFSITSNSIAWDAGTDVGLPYSFDHPDIGAYELSGEETPPNLVLTVTPPSLVKGTWNGGSISDDIMFVRNDGFGTLQYSNFVANTNWLTLSGYSGASTGEEDTYDILYDISGLTNGVYTNLITVMAGTNAGSPSYIPVTLTIATQVTNTYQMKSRGKSTTRGNAKFK